MSGVLSFVGHGILRKSNWSSRYVLSAEVSPMPLGNDFAGGLLCLRTNRAPCLEFVGFIERQCMKKAFCAAGSGRLIPTYRTGRVRVT